MAMRTNRPDQSRPDRHATRLGRPDLGPRSSPQPPLTPMIDVTCQLLLFCLLTCELRPEEGRFTRITFSREVL